MAKKDSNIYGQFVPLHHATLDSPAWRALSHGARSLYVCLRRRVIRGQDKAFVSYRQAVKETGSSPRKICEWFAELVHYRFIELAQPGCLGVDGRGKSPHWRLTECGRDSKRSPTGIFEPPTNDFLKWDGARFDPTPYRPKKQKPASYGGNGALPTGETVVLPTGETLKPESASYGCYIEDDQSASHGGYISSLPLRGCSSSKPRKGRKTTSGPFAENSDPKILALSKWGREAKRKPWRKPHILSDEPRDFHRVPIGNPRTEGGSMTTIVERNPKKGWDVVEYETGRVLATHRTGWEAESDSLARNNAELDREEQLYRWALERASRTAMGEITKWILRTCNRGMDEDEAAAVRFVASDLLLDVAHDRGACGNNPEIRQFHVPKSKARHA